MTSIELGDVPITREDVVAVATGDVTVTTTDAAHRRMERALGVVEDALRRDDVVYGVTTGFGALANTRIETEQLEEVQRNLLRSHAAGVGPPLRRELVRAMLLLRARTLAQGHSGVRPAVVEGLLALLRRDLLPVVPRKGSVGASGDLAAFAHLGLPLIGEGELDDGERVGPASEMLAAAGLEPLDLGPKEGLSLLNGTEGMLAMGVLGLDHATLLARTADVACALAVEALLATDRPFQQEIHRLRPHPGQLAAAENLARLLDGSSIVASHRESRHAVQDAYSLRCAPQVHGAVRDVLAHAARVFDVELGSVVDNPLVLPESGAVVSGGNFHGQPLAFALDFLAVAVTELGSIAERRIDRILDPERSSGLPPFLAPDPGVNSGYMLAQYTAAALVADSRIRSHPASVESIPTSGSQEDHVSMGWGAGLKLEEVLDDVTSVLAIEVLVAVEGLRHRQPLRPADGTAAAAEVVREAVPPLSQDRAVAPEIDRVRRLVLDGSLLEAVEGAIGPLS